MPVVYARHPETILYRGPDEDADVERHLLMGTWLHVLESDGDWRRVETRARTRNGETLQDRGWVHLDDVQDGQVLKAWFVDVGQGDGAVIESPNGILLIDGGPNRAFYDFVRRRAQPILEEQQRLHIDAVVVTHPDDDHFVGLTRILGDPRFTFGWIYHNGIIRYREEAGRDYDLGRFRARVIDGEEVPVLTETFDSIEDAGALLDEGLLMSRFHSFWLAAWNAYADGRLRGARRLTNRRETLPGFSGDPVNSLRVEVIAPAPTHTSGRVEYVGFPSPEHPNGGVSPSHTINGHSIVLKLRFGVHSLLFGGDLNIPAQRYLIQRYGNENPFRVDVAKICHHGSSDFAIDFLKQVRPRVNVFSSGEERMHDHPLPDALGAASRHTRGDYPLLFSTELARSVFSTRVHTGMINARSNGQVLTMAQLKERAGTDPWHTFEVPFRGRFPNA